LGKAEQCSVVEGQLRRVHGTCARRAGTLRLGHRAGALSTRSDVRYHKAFDLIGGLHFVTTMATVGIHF
jgi:hypothetical protein